MDKVKVILTQDGSRTLYLEGRDETYHSRHGAVQESDHVFIKNGLRYAMGQGEQEIRIFEVGFGTGLNALLSFNDPMVADTKVDYYGIEKFPLAEHIWKDLHYDLLIDSNTGFKISHDLIMNSDWDVLVEIDPGKKLCKLEADIFHFSKDIGLFDLIYFDAFGFRAQSEMWSKEILIKCADLLRPGGIFVTYASKGIVRRDLQNIGFQVDKLPGPPGKREMMRAIKKSE